MNLSENVVSFSTNVPHAYSATFRRQFTPHAGLNSLRRAQSIAEVGSYLAWVQAEESWWGKGFFVKAGDNQAQRVETPELKMYKVRNIP